MVFDVDVVNFWGFCFWCFFFLFGCLLGYFFGLWSSYCVQSDSDRNSLSIVFLAISDQYATLIYFSQNGCHRPFWMTEIHFWSPFQINTQLFFHKMAASGHFGWPKITFHRISRHFRTIRNFDFFSHKMAAGGHFGWPKIIFDRNFFLCLRTNAQLPNSLLSPPEATTRPAAISSINIVPLLGYSNDPLTTDDDPSHT